MFLTAKQNDMTDDFSCECQNPKANYLVFDSEQIGIDDKNGRYGEVSIKTCKKCRSKWLHYFVEYESFSRSGRWFRGEIAKDIVSKITAENAEEYLNKMDSCFAGGSYFESNGFKNNGAIRLDL